MKTLMVSLWDPQNPACVFFGIDDDDVDAVDGFFGFYEFTIFSSMRSEGFGAVKGPCQAAVHWIPQSPSLNWRLNCSG